MINFLKDFYCEEDGMGTIEIVVIIAVLVALALVFRSAITNFANDLMGKFFDSDAINVATDGSGNASGSYQPQ